MKSPHLVLQEKINPVWLYLEPSAENILRACRLAWPILRGWGSRDPGSNPGRPTNQFEDVRLFGVAWQMSRKVLHLFWKELVN